VVYLAVVDERDVDNPTLLGLRRWAADLHRREDRLLRADPAAEQLAELAAEHAALAAECAQLAGLLETKDDPTSSL
jgi:hypothetical protein